MSEISPTFVVSPLSNFCREIGAPPRDFFSDLLNDLSSWEVSTIFSSTSRPHVPQITSPLVSLYINLELLHSGHFLAPAIVKFIKGVGLKGFCFVVDDKLFYENCLDVSFL